MWSHSGGAAGACETPALPAGPLAFSQGLQVLWAQPRIKPCRACERAVSQQAWRGGRDMLLPGPHHQSRGSWGRCLLFEQEPSSRKRPIGPLRSSGMEEDGKCKSPVFQNQPGWHGHPEAVASTGTGECAGAEGSLSHAAAKVKVTYTPHSTSFALVLLLR